MTDVVDRATRSRMMSKIRACNTKPELVVRSALHGMGFRFSLHRKDLPGKPDIVLPKWNTVIFVHGCFWHCHQGCNYFRLPKSNRTFWRTKLTANKKRDQKNINQLTTDGWHVAVVWECALRDQPDAAIETTLNQLALWIRRDKYRRRRMDYSRWVPQSQVRKTKPMVSI